MDTLIEDTAPGNHDAFEVGLERPNAETLAAIDDVNNDRNLSGPYHSMQELREALNTN